MMAVPGAARRMTKRRQPGKAHTTRFPWARSTDETLLALRFKDLGLRFEHTWLQDVLELLHGNLERRGLRFRPHVWLSSDWFSPTGVPGFAAPFYLAHPRLMKLERRQVYEVEGSTQEDCLKIMRHECAHALQHAYGFQRRRKWQKLFGTSSKHYPASYRPDPHSRRHVQHLRLYYAQSHPDEDFAETFAVWLQPRAHWRKRYAGWPALKKLEYVDALMAEIGDTPPVVRSRRRVDLLSTLKTTLREHYDRKRAHYSPHYPDIYDRELRMLFSDEPRHKRHELASAFLRRNRTEIRRLVARWTGEYQFTLEQVLNDMIGRCRELKLRAVGSERLLRLDFAVLLSVKTVHFLHSRRNWIAL
jgi:hypothetical protein